MNLSDVFLKVKVPRAIEYIKDKTPISPLKLFYMDDSCLTSAKKEDMQVPGTLGHMYIIQALCRLNKIQDQVL